MVGGWELAIQNILTPWLQRYAYLPTQNTIASGPYSISLNQTIPYYDKMTSMIPIGRARPSISEYPQIAEHIQQAIYEVEHGIKNPAQAVNDAVLKSAKVLGWIEGSASTKSFAN
jgi:multiple sugar transport system substrate-binding protein